MRLFKVTEDFQLEIVPEILLIPEFSALVNKKKDETSKNLAYVYHMASLDGPYSSYEPKERHQRLANDLFDHSWVPSEKINEAIKKYVELNQTAASRTLRTVINALYKCNSIVDTLINEIEKNLAEDKHKSGINNKKGQIVSGIELMLNDLQALIKTSNEIPKAIDTFEKLEDKIIKEKQQKESRFRGGSEISEFERG
jgi:hypothetical protein